MEACFLHNRIFINSLVSFYKENRITEHLLKLEDSWNYIPPILVPSSAKRTVTQILEIAKLNEREDFILRGFFCDIIRPYKELPVQS